MAPYLPHLDRRRWTGFLPVVLGMVLLCGVIFFFARLNYTSPVLEAQDGVIDARGYALDGGPYMLTGEWLRFRGQLTPETLSEHEGSFVEDIRYIRKMRGYTYEFTLLSDQPETTYFLLPRPHNSLLWINGNAVPIGEDSTSFSMDALLLSDYAQPDDPQRFEFVLQVSSSSIYDVYQGVLIGHRNLLSSIQNRWLMLDLIAVGLYLMLCALMLVLFLQKRSELYLPLLTVSALTELAHFLLIARQPMMAFFHIGSTVFYRQFNCLNYFICKLLVCEPGDVPKWMDYIVYVDMACTLLGCLLFRENAALILRVSYITYLVMQGCVLALSARRHRSGTTILIIGWAIAAGNELFYTMLNAGIFPQGVVDVQIMPAQYARLAPILALAVVTCQKFSRKFSQSDILTAQLEQRVAERTQVLADTNRQLLDTQQTRQRFMTDIVHNLRSPLFVIEGYLDFLSDERGNLTPSGEKYLTLATEKLGYLERMVDDLFFISRLEDGQIKFHFTQFQLEELLRDAVQDAAVKAEEKHITPILRCPPILMVGDQFHLRQALDNLLDNSIRHSPAGSSIQVSAAVQGDTVCIEIQDWGDGISAEQLPHIFERYSSKGSGGSTGLGLSICREIVQHHGGKILVRSTLGEGSTFILQLPLEPADTSREIVNS